MSINSISVMFLRHVFVPCICAMYSQRGMYLHFKLQETENDDLRGGGQADGTGSVRRRRIRTPGQQRSGHVALRLTRLGAGARVGACTSINFSQSNSDRHALRRPT